MISKEKLNEQLNQYSNIYFNTIKKNIKLMNYKPIIIIPGEPNSVFLEIYFKSIKKNKFKNPQLLICSYRLLIKQMKKLKFNYKINVLNKNFNKLELKKNRINILNINYNQKKAFEKISSKSNQYIEKCFSVGLKLIKEGFSNKLINGPIIKNIFLRKIPRYYRVFGNKTKTKILK